MYVYLIESKVVLLSAFPAVSYLTLGPSAILIGSIHVYLGCSRVQVTIHGLDVCPLILWIWWSQSSVGYVFTEDFWLWDYNWKIRL